MSRIGCICEIMVWWRMRFEVLLGWIREERRDGVVRVVKSSGQGALLQQLHSLFVGQDYAFTNI